MGIKQFNGVWIKSEDRVLFRFNTTVSTEYRFWLTSRILKNLRTLITQELFHRHLLSGHDIKSKEKFKSKVRENLSQTKFNVALTFPLGEKPVLIKSVAISTVAASKKITMRFELCDQRTIDLRIDTHLLTSLDVLLEQLESQSGWVQKFMFSSSEKYEAKTEDDYKITLNKTLH